MFNAALAVALSIPSAVLKWPGVRQWRDTVAVKKVDLISQPCYSRILPGLYLSNLRAASDREVLEHLNITHILTIEARKIPRRNLEGLDITNLFIRAYDLPSTYILPYFPMSNAFIDEGMKDGNVIVHCRYGVSRSATLVIAYLMQKYGWEYEDAHHYVRQRRKFINPNSGFVEQLKEYGRSNYDVGGFRRMEAYVSVTARKHKYKIATVAAVVFGIIIPAVLLIA